MIVQIELGRAAFLHTDPQQTSDYLFQLFEDYYHEAARLRDKYADRIGILIGMEIDWIRPSSEAIIRKLQQDHHFDFFVGSVHHVHEIPIDFSYELFLQAQSRSGGTIEKLYEDYFDIQYEMLEALKPPIVGHFDLIRLKSEDPDAVFRDCAVAWTKAMRNLDFIVGYGGIIELNSAALRKGLKEPYPNKEFCQVSGRKCLQSVENQVCTWYPY